jgi:N-acetylglucosaminyl-diphospho-decaprenol L-rhamnosyltransferase
VLPIYVIHWNAPDWCSATVRSLLESEGVDLDITVIDNASELLPEIPFGVKLERLRSNRGYAGAANRALDLYRSRSDVDELCVITSHDLRIERNALRLILEAAIAHPEYGVLGANGSSSISENSITERAWVSGTCLVLRRGCVDAVGGFDERYGSYVEDIDLCKRVADLGWKVGIVEHASAYSIGSSNEKRAIILTHANHVLLDAKMGHYGLVGRRIFGLARRCVTNPRRLDIWAPSLLLGCRQLVRWAAKSPERLRS